MFDSRSHFKKQIKIINLAKKFNNNLKFQKIDYSSSPLTYMTTWVKTPGYYQLKKLRRIIDYGKFTFFIKDILSIAKLYDLESVSSIDEKTFRNSNLIISYCSKNNFKRDGTYFDEFFGVETNIKNLIWVLISLDNYQPKNLGKNILIIKKKKDKSFSIIYLLKIILSSWKILISFKKNKIFSHLSYNYFFSKKINKILQNLLYEIKFKNVLLNYEGIPFQNNLINYLSQIKKNTKFLCYLHCAAWPIQTELLYKQDKIDSLFVSGIDQKNVLTKYYSWPSKKVKVIPSLRFKKTKKNSFGGFLFVPFEIFNKDIFLNKVKKFLELVPKRSLSNLTVRVHPLNKKSKVHQEVSEKLKNLLKLYSLKFKKKTKKKNSMIFGNATGVCIQSIEEGNKVFHIPDDIEVDLFSNKIWKNIFISQKAKNIFTYEIKKKNQIFKTVNKKRKFEKYLLPYLR